MKYFTRAWIEGNIGDEESEAVLRGYQEHIASLLPLLPDSVAELATTVNLHDGLLYHVQVDRQNQLVLLRLVCGDLQVGYHDVALTYAGVDFDHLDLSTLRMLARDRESEALYDEVDQSNDGYFVHRIAFRPGGEILVRFRHVKLASEQRVDRSIPFVEDRYQEIDAG